MPILPGFFFPNFLFLFCALFDLGIIYSWQRRSEVGGQSEEKQNGKHGREPEFSSMAGVRTSNHGVWIAGVQTRGPRGSLWKEWGGLWACWKHWWPSLYACNTFSLFSSMTPPPCEGIVLGTQSCPLLQLYEFCHISSHNVKEKKNVERVKCNLD